MAKMTLKQARAMRDGILKGDSAMAVAWKELLGGEPLEQAAEAAVASAGERGEKTLARMRAMQDEGGF